MVILTVTKVVGCNPCPKTFSFSHALTHSHITVIMPSKQGRVKDDVIIFQYHPLNKSVIYARARIHLSFNFVKHDYTLSYYYKYPKGDSNIKELITLSSYILSIPPCTA